MKKKIIFGIICFVVLLVCILWRFYLSRNKKYPNSWESDWNIHVLTSIDDEVVWDSMRCGTFQLVWNDMVNNVVKQDVIFTPQLEIVENLNKQTFTKKQLSSKSYFSKFWLFTLNLKNEIEEGVKKKFDETSDILGQIDWSGAPQSDDGYYWKRKKYAFYTMLKKIFKFKNVFDELDKWKFNNKYDNTKFFWIKWTSDSSLYRQVYVYYYNSDEDFAVALKTKEWEDVILARWIWWSSFINIYWNILNNAEEYKWKHYFTEDDYLKIPELKFKTLSEFGELEFKDFYMGDWSVWYISKALQSIELKLDKEGWEIKSEAAIVLETNGIMIATESPKIEHRYFYFDKPYIMFLKEENKDLPYFAAQISDITLFQN